MASRASRAAFFQIKGASAILLRQLQQLGIGGAGTVRTTRTRREELDGKKGQREEQENNQTKSLIEQIYRMLADLKLPHQSQIEWGTLYGRLSGDGTVMVRIRCVLERFFRKMRIREPSTA